MTTPDAEEERSAKPSSVALAHLQSSDSRPCARGWDGRLVVRIAASQPTGCHCFLVYAREPTSNTATERSKRDGKENRQHEELIGNRHTGITRADPPDNCPADGRID